MSNQMMLWLNQTEFIVRLYIALLYAVSCALQFLGIVWSRLRSTWGLGTGSIALNPDADIEMGQANMTQLAQGDQSRLSLVTSATQLKDIVACLVQHGCQDLTTQLDEDRCDQRPLAGGGFSTIYRGWLRDGQQVAMKCIEVTGSFALWAREPKSLKHATHELYTWSKCDHPSILRVLGFASLGGHILIILPWMPMGDVPSYIRQNPNCDRLQLCIQLAAAVEYLHSRDMIHGDIKADNVVVSTEGHALLADFGSATLKTYTTLCFTDTGPKSTCRFMAPELLTDTRVVSTLTFATDIYALGMAVLQILSGALPFRDINNEWAVVIAVACKKAKPARPDFGQILTHTAEDELWNLLMHCWECAPEDRPTATTVRQALTEIGLAVL